LVQNEDNRINSFSANSVPEKKIINVGEIVS